MKQSNILLLIFVIWLMLPHSSISQRSLLQEEFSDPDFSTPADIESHVFNFFHHSCGWYLLSDGLYDDLQTLGYTLHSKILVTYEHENNYTDYRHWYKRFQRELGIKEGEHYYRYEGPDANGKPILGEQIDDDYRDFMLNYYDFNAELMDIIMFKPCYPGSYILDQDTEYDKSSENNGYGIVTGGTPYSDNGNNNFVYLNSSASVDAQYDENYWSSGSWIDSRSSLAQLKCAYRGMLNIFVNHPDLLFIAMQAPPRVNLPDYCAFNCREFARWIREDWLHQYDPTGTDRFEDYPEVNVVPFDFHNSIAWTGEDPALDNEYFWFVENGFPDNTLDTNDPDYLGRNAGNDNHPESWLNKRTSTIFSGGIDTYSNSHTGQPARTYNSWINAIVNRWEKGKQPVPVQLSTFFASVTNNIVNLEWIALSESNNYGFEIERSKDNSFDFNKIGFVAGRGTTSSSNSYQYIDKIDQKGQYFYRLKQIDYDGQHQYSKTIKVDVISSNEFNLMQNYPNPFNTETRIDFVLNRPVQIKIDIYNLSGEKIKSVLNVKKNTGPNYVIWDGKNEQGKQVASGIYYYRLIYGFTNLTKKMILLR